MKLIINKGFSFVEIIVVISIIAILGVVATTTSNTFTNNTKNSKVTADIDTIKLSLNQFQEDTKKLPSPKGNKKFYLKDTSYAHGPEDNPFAVSGFITETTLPKKYINYLPLDPRTNQYYGYAKTYGTGAKFEIAGVNMNNGDYESVVRGSYTGEDGPYSLVKEYNGNDFVFDTSKNHFAYNPEERILVGNISDYNGIVTIDSLELGILNDANDIIDHELIKGDKITVKQNGSANIIFSDGSQLSLGSTEEDTELAIADMEFKEENNLFTDIKLVLNIGSAFTKAAKLDSKSNFEVYTSDTVAAVRGTVFGVRKTTNNGTNIVVKRGAVKVQKNISNNSNFDDLIKNIGNNKIQKENITLGGVIGSDSIITVNKNDEEKGILIKKEDNLTFDSPISNTGAISIIPNLVKERIIDNTGDLNNSVQIIVNKVNIDLGVNIFLKINNLLRSNGTSIILNNGDNIFELKNQGDNWGLEGLVLNGSKNFIERETGNNKNFNNIINNKNKISLKFCKSLINGKNICTKEKEINLKYNFISDELKSNNKRITEEMVTLKDKIKNNKKIPDSAIPEKKITKYHGTGCSMCPNHSSLFDNITGEQYCTDIKKIGGGKVICQKDHTTDIEWEGERTNRDPYSRIIIKEGTDIINLGNNSSQFSSPIRVNDSIEKNINYGSSYANKSINIRFKGRIRGGWEAHDVHRGGRIIPKDEFIVKSNGNEIDRLTYGSLTEVNVYIDENYEYDYTIILDGDGKTEIEFNVQSSMVSEVMDITEIKAILTETVTP